jgi:capsular exopolysaccharide synthesis family protein
VLGADNYSADNEAVKTVNMSNPQGSGGPAFAGTSGGGSGLDFSKIVKVLLRRWIMLLCFAVIGGVGGYIYTVKATPIFLAEAELEMSVRRPKVVNSDVLFEDGTSARDTDVIFNTRFAKFRSPAMEKLATLMYFEKYSPVEYIQRESHVGLEDLAHWVRKVQWWKDSQANIVRVSFSSPDAEFAAGLVNVMTVCAGELMMQENRALSDGAVQWLLSQVEEQRNSLENVEKQLAEIRQELQLDSLQQRRDVLSGMQGSLTQESAQLESQLASRKTLHKFVSSVRVREESLEALPPGLPKEDQLNELMTAWRAANDQLLQIADRLTEKHPQYQQVAEIEDRARRRLDRFIDLSAESVSNEVELLEQQVEQVNARIEMMKAESLELDIKLAQGTRKLQRLERQRDAADASYQSILSRMEEARVAADENTAFVKVIREASIPTVPVSPEKKTVLVVGLFIGLLLGSGLAVGLELWKDKVSSVNELKAMGLTVLGTLPRVKTVISRGELAMVGVRDKFSPVVEVFAGINTLISSARYRGQTKVVLVCSAMPGEGKTISASNLAISSARNGTKTLLIDGDLRRPRVAGIFRIDEEKPSLLEWMADDEMVMDHDELVSSEVVDSLDVITSRPLHGISPAELLGRSPLAELIAWARENYERIIIDSPPLSVVGDALVLAGHADSVVMVSRIGVSERRSLQFVLAHLREIDAHVLGCIANDVPYSLAGKFSGGEGYGYGHNYNSYVNG